MNSIIFQFLVMDQYTKTNHSHFIFSLAPYFPGEWNESEVKTLPTSTPESNYMQSSTEQSFTVQSSTVQSSTLESISNNEFVRIRALEFVLKQVFEPLKCQSKDCI